MSWRDGRDSCTCSCTLTGLPAQIPTELRRGSANKTQTVILEVPPYASLHTFLQSPPFCREKRETLPLNPFHIPLHYITYILLYYIIHSYCYTLHYVACFSPILGVLGRYIIYIIIYVIIHIYELYIFLLYITHTHTHLHEYITFIYILNVILLYYIYLYDLTHITNRECGHAHTHAHVRAYVSALYVGKHI